MPINGVNISRFAQREDTNARGASLKDSDVSWRHFLHRMPNNFYHSFVIEAQTFSADMFSSPGSRNEMLRSIIDFFHCEFNIIDGLGKISFRSCYAFHLLISYSASCKFSLFIHTSKTANLRCANSRIWMFTANVLLVYLNSMEKHELWNESYWPNRMHN